MSISSTTELIIQIDSIRSIDILSQGLFYLKFEIKYTKASENISAFPYKILTSPYKAQTVVSAPSIENFTYNTQIFLIKFFDEVVHLNEICFFRIQNELSLTNCESSITLNCKLMYHPATITWSKETLQETCKNLENFKEKASLEYTIPKSLKGFHQFLPIHISGGVSLLINSCIHLFKSGYAFIKPSKNIQADEYAKLKLKSIKNSGFKEILAKTLFGSNQNINRKDLLEAYEKLVISLAEYYQKTKKTCENLVKYIKSCEIQMNLADLTEEIQQFHKALSDKVSNSFKFVTIQDSVKLIAKGLWSITKNLSNLLEHFSRLLQTASNSVVNYLLPNYNHQQISRLNRHKVFTLLKCDDFQDAPVENHAFRHMHIAEDFRRVLLQDNENDAFACLKFENSGKEFTVAFVDTIIRPFCVSEDPGGWMRYVGRVSKGTHLVVLVHGLYGASTDMRLIRNTIYALWPEVNVLCSYYNEGKTGGDIEKMGKRLAQEVNKYISDHFYHDSLEKLSFIGYSLGGLIARTSLLYLPDYLSNLHFLVTLSTPHLGCYSNTSKLVNAGMWIMKKFKRSKSLSQLVLKDSKDAKFSFIYKLGSSSEIEHFKHISFVSSCQDKYSPIHSSRVEPSPHRTSEKEVIQSEIANNILSRLSCNRLIRVDANFLFNSKGLDNAIGRAAHIEMIDNKNLIELVLSECSSFFADN